jgi:hypothetical protein
MAFEVINVLEYFLAFIMTFNATTIHNMCVLQLNPRFKGLQCIMEYVSQNKVATIVEKYDQHVLLPFLVVVSKHLNLGCMEGPPPSTPLFIVTNMWMITL